MRVDRRRDSVLECASPLAHLFVRPPNACDQTRCAPPFLAPIPKRQRARALQNLAAIRAGWVRLRAGVFPSVEVAHGRLSR